MELNKVSMFLKWSTTIYCSFIFQWIILDMRRKKYHMTIYTWSYFRTLFSVPLICIFKCMPKTVWITVPVLKVLILDYTWLYHFKIVLANLLHWVGYMKTLDLACKCLQYKLDLTVSGIYIGIGLNLHTILIEMTA